MSSIRVIALGGELDIARRDEARFALQLRDDDVAILLDFTDATYADSTILSVLLKFVQSARDKRVAVAILIGTKQFARIIQYAGLADVLPVFESREAALTHLTARPA